MNKHVYILIKLLTWEFEFSVIFTGHEVFFLILGWGGIILSLQMVQEQIIRLDLAQVLW